MAAPPPAPSNSTVEKNKVSEATPSEDRSPCACGRSPSIVESVTSKESTFSVDEEYFEGQCCRKFSFRSCLLIWGIILFLCGALQALMIIVCKTWLYYVIEVFNPTCNLIVTISLLYATFKRSLKMLKFTFVITIIHIILMGLGQTVVWVYALKFADFDEVSRQANRTAEEEKDLTIIFLSVIAGGYLANAAIEIVICCLIKRCYRRINELSFGTNNPTMKGACHISIRRR